VLLIDCDHQRSLTSLCIRNARRDVLHKRPPNAPAISPWPGSDATGVPGCAYDLPNMVRCSIVINTAERDGPDGLANVEERLMLDWLTSLDAPFDIRLALRSALHGNEVSSQFDYILLDCPPRLGTASDQRNRGV